MLINYWSMYSFLYFIWQKPQEEGSPVGPWLLALFIFVVCGSGNFYLNINKMGHLKLTNFTKYLMTLKLRDD